MEVFLALNNGWEELIQEAEKMILHLVKSLQEGENYQMLTMQASRLYPLAGSFKLGLNEHGGLPRVTFKGARKILRSLGSTSLETDDFS
jgi:hypothetical protein